MDPPAALQGAMGRERKPFTYTPGGIDLSQIKSERMARRLMRNAMNPGVGETSPQLQSPTTPTTPVMVPNFNCLPVQVFPAFNLPANPKSLLRTRSTPASTKDQISNRVQTRENKQIAEPMLPADCRKIQAPPVDIRVNDDNRHEKERPASMYTMPSEYLDKKNGKPKDAKIDNTRNGYVGFDDAHSNESGMRPISLYDLPSYVNATKAWETDTACKNNMEAERNSNKDQKHITIQTPTDMVYKTPDENDEVSTNNVITSDCTIISNCQDSSVTNKCDETPQIDKREVKVVKKQEKHSEITESSKQNGENGIEAEAELTVKLPSKKSEAKTETNVETSKRTLHDGSIEEVTKTITKTTIDGKTEITTKTETKTIPVETTEIVEVFEGEEEEEEDDEVIDEDEEEEEELHQNQVATVKKGILKKVTSSDVTENGEADTVVKNEEKSETTTTRKVVVVQNEETEEEEESEYEEVEEDEEEEEEVTEKTLHIESEQEENDEGVEVEKDENYESTEEVSIDDEVQKDEVAEEKREGEKQELEELQVREENECTKIEVTNTVETEETEEAVETQVVNKNEEEENKPDSESIKQTNGEVDKIEESKEGVESKIENENNIAGDDTKTSRKSEEVTEQELLTKETVQNDQKQTPTQEPEKPSEPIKLPETEKPQTRSIPIHFENIEDVEIKPISQSFSKSQSEKTEITTNKDSQCNPSIQTELHREEKVVVTNRITKTLDHNYEQITQGLPTVKTYFAPNREKVPTSPQPSKPYQSSYTDESKTERRHSLLLDRLSTERQLPSSVQYQSPYSYTAPHPTQEPQRETSQEPQCEILTVSNVKPSTIANQKWYQHDSLRENVTYDVTQSTPAPSWTQPTKPKIQVQCEPQYKQQPTQTLYTPPIDAHYVSPSEPQYVLPGQPQYEAPTQPQYQSPSQPQYQAPTQPQYHSPSQPQYQAPTQPQYQSPSQPQYQAPTQPQYQAPPSQYSAPPKAQYEPSYQQQKLNTQSSYTDNYSKTSSTQNFSKSSSYENTYASSLPKSWGANDALSINEPSYLKDTYKSPVENMQPYSLNKETTQSYQNNSQYSSGYVPPPWEQDSCYVSTDYLNNNKTSFYQTTQSAPVTPSVSATPSWNAKPGKFSKPAPKAYVPPAPNQSFVKPVSDVPQPKIPGRKTYYSEYERRYISVPETTYVPSEAKHQHQPNPSPQYYYDDGEAAEKEEHSWRKELREFTQKSSQPQYQQEASVQPPWEEENKYAKAPAYNPTPTWSQTLNPRASCDRTFESEYVSQDWQKTSTLGRSRPLSYVQSNVETKVTERTRGVSMDRYNPNQYHSPIPSEHPPVQGQTLTPANAPQNKGHNPSAPAYRRDRSSAEPREMPSYQQPRYGHDPRLSPVQSRSFKYLQWITGTDHRH